MNNGATGKMIPIQDVTLSYHHRAVKPWSLENIKASIQEHGYNVAFPITIDANGELVDGRHRLEAARACGLTEVPCIIKPDGVSNIRFGLQCNGDGQLAAANDVFDYAELCWGLAREGWGNQQIADEIGWKTDIQVIQYKQIRERLCSQAWELARGLTKNDSLVSGEEEDLVSDELTKVSWTERHFRALLKHLPCADGDRPVMRTQVKAIQEILDRFHQNGRQHKDKKVTANWIEKYVALRYAWYVKLEKYMRDNLVKEVPIRDRIKLLNSVRANVFGVEPSEVNLEKFAKAVAALNEHALGIKLYWDDALQRIPLLADGSVALVIADPPYNVTGHDWDKIGTDDEYLEWMRRWLTALRPKLAEDYHLFVFCSPEYQARIEINLKADDWPLKSRVIWSHRNMSLGREIEDKFISNWDMVFHCGTHALNWHPNWGDERFEVQEHAVPQSNFKQDPKLHPTAKPLALIELFVGIGSKPGDVVLDPFAGGGTTGQACANISQRKCILVEKLGEYCGTIEDRLGIKRIAGGE